MDFISQLKELNQDHINISATVIKGSFIGRKALYSNGILVFCTGDTDFFQVVKDVAVLVTENQVSSIEDNLIFFEVLRPYYKMVICGGGHISIPLIKMGKMMEFQVTVLEDRPFFANQAREAGADMVICDNFEQGLSKVEGDHSTFFIIVTRGHRYDQLCLSRIIHKKHAYIGMIGSKVRVRKVKDMLMEQGIEKELLDEVYTPIGLKILAETPVEIAVAILGEIIEVKNQKKANTGYSKEIMKALDEETYRNLPKAMVTIVTRKGSAPRDVGTKMLVFKDGTMIGTIGGGCVEANVRQTAMDVINNTCPVLELVDMTGRVGEEDGMVCGGMIEVFVEPIL